MRTETFLQVTGLPDDQPFDLEPWRNPVDGQWLMKVKAEGLADNAMHPSRMIAYVDQVRETNPALAEKIDHAIAAWQEASGRG